MSKLFLHLLNISITAGWIVLVVVLLRFVLKKAPKWTRVVLWGLVALRLLLPVSIESPLSLVPSEQTVSIATWTLPDTTVGTSEEGSAAQRTTTERVVFQTGFPALNIAINPTMKQSYEHHSTVSTVKTVAGWVWLVGVVGMLFYALISFLRLRHRVRASVKFEKGAYVCDEIKDPFILGLIVPKIYLPSGMDEQTRAYVLAHELAHLKRFDHIWKPLGFLLLSVYWFNPLLWLAYILLCRDIELACDEKVIRELDDTGKAAYSEALVTASVSRRSIAACPLAFGETGVKSRVKSVLNYKKPAFWIILVALLACIAVAVCFLTMPKKNQPDAAEIVGTWEFYKQIVDTYETDWPIQEMLGTRRDVLIFRENGTGTELYIRDDVTRENPFTYTVSGNKVSITRNGRDRVPVEFTYDPESSMLRSPEDAGEGLRWYTLYVREGSISYPTVQLTNEQIAGEWKTDGLPVMEGMPLTLSGDLVFDANGTAVLHLNGDNHTEMTVNGTYDTEGSVIRFEPEDDTAVLEYYPWIIDQSMLFHLSIKDFKPEYQNTALASYDPQTDTIRFVVLHFGVLTFHRSIPATAMPVVQWLDYYNDFEGFSWDSSKEITVAAFPGVTFRWTAGSVEAVENGKTRTLFSGMPVWSVYFTDLTGDGKPDLCATVSFGSGIVDEHIIVYDYVSKQSYLLLARMQFDFHLYTVDGALYVGKTPYMGDKQVDSGTLELHDGVLSCRWQSDGSYTALYPELHESELYGEWLVEEEKDNDGNTLYTFDVASTWKEYNFKEDGTVTYNETVPISSDYEKAFGHPVTYPYEVHNDYVYIAGDDTSGAFRFGQSDRDTRTLTLMYNTDAGTVYAKLRRMGTEGPQTIEEILLGTYVCTGAEQNGVSIPIPAEYAGMTIDLGDTSEGDTYKHTSTVTIGGETMDGHGWTLDEDDMLIVWDQKTGKSMRFEWFPKQTTCTVLKLTIDQADPITLIFTVEDDALPALDVALPAETDMPTAEVTPEPSPVPLFGSWTPETGYHKIEPMGTVPEVFHTMIDQNLFRMGLGQTLQYTYGFADRVLTYSPHLQNDTVTYTISFDLYDLYGTLLLHAETALDPYFQLESAIATTDGGIVFAVSFTDRSLDDGTWASEHYDKATAYIIKIGADGKQQWKTALPTYTGWALGSCIEYDGACFFFGNYETPEQKQLGIVSSSNISIIKIGNNGTILKQQELGGDDFDTVSLIDTDADGFILYADTQNSKGEFAASRYWKMFIDDDLNVIRMEPVDEYGHRFARYLGVVQGKRVFTDDPRYFHYSDGSITCVLDYGAFILVVSENDTGIYENQPKWINMTWNYTETVYAAYDLQGNLLWKTAVDSSPNFDAWAPE